MFGEYPGWPWGPAPPELPTEYFGDFPVVPPPCPTAELPAGVTPYFGEWLKAWL